MAIPEQVKYYSSFRSFWLANVRVAEVSRSVFYKKFVFHYTLRDNIFDRNAAFANVHYNQFIYLHIFVVLFEVNVSPCIYLPLSFVGRSARVDRLFGTRHMFEGTPLRFSCQCMRFVRFTSLRTFLEPQ